jgi:uncharacterized HAD superfamily protein
MKIAIDIDDTLSNTLDPLFAFYQSKSGKKFKREQHTTYNLHETWGCSLEESIKVLNEFHKLGHLYEVITIQGAKQAIKEISSKNEILIITSRPIKFKDS